MYLKLASYFSQLASNVSQLKTAAKWAALQKFGWSKEVVSKQHIEQMCTVHYLTYIFVNTLVVSDPFLHALLWKHAHETFRIASSPTLVN